MFLNVLISKSNKFNSSSYNRKMCYDSEIFKNKIDDNLFCPICRSVLCIESMQVCYLKNFNFIFCFNKLAKIWLFFNT
jgi:hypothetical protein